ncbi:DUF3427 domain-containing protein [Peribacillus sp. SCS-26]|uniref:DUF3427 domain-containing protein n=1 Tax=Paraperibacillus marinus TaxID=3115295 RepID=UPI003906D113
MNKNYYDSGQLKSRLKLFELKGEQLTKTRTFTEVLEEERFRVYFEDLVNYAMFRYEKEFKQEYYGVPHLKLYEQYLMVDAALLSNYRKMHSAFRGSGLITHGNDFFLYIDLHKEADIKESINYHDEFKSQSIFQWQTPNAVSQQTDRGKNIIFNKDRGIHLHLFVRKYKKIDGKIEPYIYIGNGNTIEYAGEKPITVQFQLEHEIPINLYNEFTKRV